MTTENQRIKIVQPACTVLEKFSQATMDALKEKLKLGAEGVNKNRKIRNALYAICCICGEIPNYKVGYDASDLDYYGIRRCGTKIEHYCKDCLKRCYEREENPYYKLLRKLKV